MLQNKLLLHSPVLGKIKELILLMHGSFQSKQKLIDDFNTKYPECSKLSIEKKMKDLFVKEKQGDDPKARWYATESTLVVNGLEEDQSLKSLSEERLNVVKEEMQKQKDEMIKMKEEKKIQRNSEEEKNQITTPQNEMEK